jgi:hypothetical protein
VFKPALSNTIRPAGAAPRRRASRARWRERRAHLGVRATSRRPEATLPEVGSTPRVTEVRAPPRGVPALAALRARCCPPVRRWPPGARQSRMRRTVS